MRKLGWLDFAIYLFIGAIGAFIMISIFNWMNTRDMALFSTTSPLIFPFLIGAALLVFIVLTVLSDLRGLKKTDIEDDNEEEYMDITVDVGKALLYSVGVIAYTYVIRKISFLPGTILFLIIAMVIMNHEELMITKRFGKAAMVSVVAVPLLYYIFYKIFNVMLP